MRALTARVWQWPTAQMDNVRLHTPGVADERRVELEAQISVRDRRVGRQNVSAHPSARRLAHHGFAVNRQLQVDRRPIGHGPYGSAPAFHGREGEERDAAAGGSAGGRGSAGGWSQGWWRPGAMSELGKITEEHQRRRAVVYVPQSIG